MKSLRPKVDTRRVLAIASDPNEPSARSPQQWSRGIERATSFIERIETPGAEFGQVHLPARTKTGAFTFPWCEQSQLVNDFVKVMYQSHLVIVFDWVEWPERKSFVEHPERIAPAGFSDCLKLLTMHLRLDRFSEGHLIAAFEQGQITSILRRMRELRQANESLEPLLELETL